MCSDMCIYVNMDRVIKCKVLLTFCLLRVLPCTDSLVASIPETTGVQHNLQSMEYQNTEDFINFNEKDTHQQTFDKLEKMQWFKKERNGLSSKHMPNKGLFFHLESRSNRAHGVEKETINYPESITSNVHQMVQHRIQLSAKDMFQNNVEDLPIPRDHMVSMPASPRLYTSHGDMQNKVQFSSPATTPSVSSVEDELMSESRDLFTALSELQRLLSGQSKSHEINQMLGDYHMPITQGGLHQYLQQLTLNNAGNELSQKKLSFLSNQNKIIRLDKMYQLFNNKLMVDRTKRGHVRLKRNIDSYAVSPTVRQDSGNNINFDSKTVNKSRSSNSSFGTLLGLPEQHISQPMTASDSEAVNFTVKSSPVKSTKEITSTLNPSIKKLFGGHAETRRSQLTGNITMARSNFRNTVEGTTMTLKVSQRLKEPMQTSTKMTTITVPGGSMNGNQNESTLITSGNMYITPAPSQIHHNTDATSLPAHKSIPESTGTTAVPIRTTVFSGIGASRGAIILESKTTMVTTNMEIHKTSASPTVNNSSGSNVLTAATTASVPVTTTTMSPSTLLSAISSTTLSAPTHTTIGASPQSESQINITAQPKAITSKPEPTISAQPEATTTAEPQATTSSEPEATSTLEPEVLSATKPKQGSQTKPTVDYHSLETTVEPKPEPEATPGPVAAGAKPDGNVRNTSGELTYRTFLGSSKGHNSSTSGKGGQQNQGSKAEPSKGPEHSGKPETNQDGNPKPEAESNANSPTYAEPEPEWTVAKAQWGVAWDIHVYGVGISFACLAIYSLISVIRLWRQKNLLSQGYFIALNSIMFVMGVVRALYFLIDGYNSNMTFPPVASYFLYSIGFPCLTSAFSILFLALLQCTRMQLVSPKIQKIETLFGVIFFHFTLSITTDIVVGYFYDSKVLLLICQVASVIWGLVLSIGYIYIFKKLYVAALRRQKEMLRVTLWKSKMEGVSPSRKQPKMTLSVAIKVTLITAIFGLVCVILQTYAMFGVYSIFSMNHPEPWPWWGFKLGLRLTELGMCITMSYVATQPFRYQQDKSGCNIIFCDMFYEAPCRRLCDCKMHEGQEESLHWADFESFAASENDTTNVAFTNCANPNFVDPEEMVPINELGLGNKNRNMSYQNSENQPLATESHRRPHSMLVEDNGFIRFRQEGETGSGPQTGSTDDELHTSETSIQVMETEFSQPDHADTSNSKGNLRHNRSASDYLIHTDKADYAPTRHNRLYSSLKDKGVILDSKFGDRSNDPQWGRPLSQGSKHHNCSVQPVQTVPSTVNSSPARSSEEYVDHEEDKSRASSAFSFRPPSSIRLVESIDNALNMPDFASKNHEMRCSPGSKRAPYYRAISDFSPAAERHPQSKHKHSRSLGDLKSILLQKSPKGLWKRTKGSNFSLNNGNSVPYSLLLSDDPFDQVDDDDLLKPVSRYPLVRSYSDSKAGQVFSLANESISNGLKNQSNTSLHGTSGTPDVQTEISNLCSAIGQLGSRKKPTLY